MWYVQEGPCVGLGCGTYRSPGRSNPTPARPLTLALALTLTLTLSLIPSQPLTPTTQPSPTPTPNPSPNPSPNPTSTPKQEARPHGPVRHIFDEFERRTTSLLDDARPLMRYTRSRNRGQVADVLLYDQQAAP